MPSPSFSENVDNIAPSRAHVQNTAQELARGIGERQSLEPDRLSPSSPTTHTSPTILLKPSDSTTEDVTDSSGTTSDHAQSSVFDQLTNENITTRSSIPPDSAGGQKSTKDVSRAQPSYLSSATPSTTSDTDQQFPSCHITTQPASANSSTPLPNTLSAINGQHSGDFLSQFLGGRRCDRVAQTKGAVKYYKDKQLYECAGDLERFGTQLQDNITTRCQKGKYSQSFHGALLFLTVDRNGTKLCLEIKCWKKHFKKFKEIIKKLSLSSTEEYDRLQGGGITWDQIKMIHIDVKPLKGDTENCIIRNIGNHCDGVPYPILGKHIDRPHAKATSTALVVLDGSFHVLTSYHPFSTEDDGEENSSDIESIGSISCSNGDSLSDTDNEDATGPQLSISSSVALGRPVSNVVSVGTSISIAESLKPAATGARQLEVHNTGSMAESQYASSDDAPAQLRRADQSALFYDSMADDSDARDGDVHQDHLNGCILPFCLHYSTLATKKGLAVWREHQEDANISTGALTGEPMPASEVFRAPDNGTPTIARKHHRIQEWPAFKYPAHDWAAFKIEHDDREAYTVALENSRTTPPQIVNKIRVKCRDTYHNIFITDVFQRATGGKNASIDQLIEGEHLWVKTRDRFLPCLGSKSQGPNVFWQIQLLSGAFMQGDSGSPVLDICTGKLYGILVQAALPFGIGFVVPASQFQADASHRCALSYSENFQGRVGTKLDKLTDLPSVEETISLMPIGHPVLPRPDEILALYVREGEPGPFRQLFCSFVQHERFTGDTDTWRLTKHNLVREAIQYDRPDIVSFLLEGQIQVDALDGHEQTPLHYAASHGRREICEKLISHNASLMSKDAGGATPLLLALRHGQFDAAHLLIESDRSGNSLLEPDGKGETPLSAAALWRSADTIELLLQDRRVQIDERIYEHVLHKITMGYRGDRHEISDKDEPDGNSSKALTPVKTAAKMRCLSAVRRALNLVGLKQPELHYEALQQAAYNGEEDWFLVLFDCIGTQLGKPYQVMLKKCLIDACATSSEKIVETLLAAGADPLCEVRGRSALQAAIEAGYQPVVVLLLEQLSRASNTAPRLRAMCWAAGKGHTELIKLLRQHPALATTSDYTLRSRPLHQAASHGHEQATEELLNGGAEVDARDFRHQTPLMLAAKRGHLDVMKTLQAAGADLNCQTNGRHTALELAACEGRTPVVEWLLQNGCSSNVDDRVLCAAARSRACSPDTMRVLLDYVTPNDPLVVLRNSLEGHPGTCDVLVGHVSISLSTATAAMVAPVVPRLSYESFEKLWQHYSKSADFSHIMVAAFANTQDGHRLVERILPQLKTASVNPDDLLCMASSNEYFGLDLVILLQAELGINTSARALEAAAGNARWGAKILGQLLAHYAGEKIMVTQRLLKQVAGNYNQQKAAFSVLVASEKLRFRPQQVLDTVEMFDLKVIESMLDRLCRFPDEDVFFAISPGPSRLLEALYEAGCSNKIGTMDCDEDLPGDLTTKFIDSLIERTNAAKTTITLSPRMVESLAQRPVKKVSNAIVARLLSASCVVLPSHSTMLRAVQISIARFFPFATFKSTIAKSPGQQFITTPLLEAAAENTESAEELLPHLLLAHSGDDRAVAASIVTESVFRAAARNAKSGATILELLNPYLNEDMLTASFWDAIATSPSQGIVTYIRKVLLPKFPPKSTRGWLSYLICNHWAVGEEVLELVQSELAATTFAHEDAISIARHMKGSTLSAILGRLDHITCFPEMLEAAVANWDHGVDMVSSLLERRPTSLDAFHVPNRTMMAVVGNWSMADKILRLFLRQKMVFSITESVLTAAVQNPLTGVGVIKILKERDLSALITPRVLAQAAANVAHALELLKLLLPPVCKHLLTPNVLAAAAGNGAAGRDLLIYLCNRVDVKTINSDVLLAAAKNNEAGQMCVVTPMHAPPRCQLKPFTPQVKNQNRLRHHSGQIGPVSTLLFEPGKSNISSTSQPVLLIWGDASNRARQNSLRVRVRRQWAWRDGWSFLEYLLSVVVDVKLGSILEQAAEHSTVKMLSLLLDRGDRVTEGIFRRAAMNKLHGPEMVQMVLLRYPKLTVSESIFSAALSNESKGGDVVEILCCHTMSPAVDPSLLELASSRMRLDESIWLTGNLLDADFPGAFQFCPKHINGPKPWRALTAIQSKPIIDSDIICIAAASPVFAPRFVDFIVRQGQCHELTTAILAAAAGNEMFAPHLLWRLLQLPRAPALFSLSPVLVATVQNEASGMIVLNILSDSFTVEECASSIDDTVLSLAASNHTHGPEMVRQLFTTLRRASMPWVASEPVLLAAAANSGLGDVVMKNILLEAEDAPERLTCDQGILATAVRNTGCATELMRLVIAAFQVDEFSHTVWLEACKNKFHGAELVKLMLQSTKDRSHIGKDLFQAAAANCSVGVEIIRTLLSAASTAAVTEMLVALDQCCGDLCTTNDIVAMVAASVQPIPCVNISIDTVLLLDSDTFRELQCATKLLIVSGFKREEEFPTTAKEALPSISQRMLNLILNDDNTILEWSVVEYIAQSCDVATFLLFAKRYDTTHLVSAISRNDAHGGDIFETLVYQDILSADSHMLSYAIKHHNKELLDILVARTSWPTIQSVINYASDDDLFQFLLNSKGAQPVTENLLLAALPSAASLRLLLALDSPENMAITESVMLAVLEGVPTTESFMLLLEHSPNPFLTDAVLIAVFAKAQILGLRCLKVVVDLMRDSNLSCSVVTSAARSPEALNLLAQKFNKIPLYNTALEAAGDRPECLDLLWHRREESKPAGLALATAAHEYSWSRLENTPTAGGFAAPAVTEDMLKVSMSHLQHFEKLLRRYHPKLCSQSLIGSAVLAGASTINALSRHFEKVDISLFVFKSAADKASPESFSLIIDLAVKCPRSWTSKSIVHTFISSRVPWAGGEDDKKLEILTKRFGAIIPPELLPLTFTFPHATFRNVVRERANVFTTETLREALSKFNAPELRFPPFKHFLDAVNGRFSQNFTAALERDPNIATEELFVHALLCKNTPFEVIEAIARAHKLLPERLGVFVEIAYHARNNNAHATLLLLLKLMSKETRDDPGLRTAETKARERIQELLIGDWKMTFGDGESTSATRTHAQQIGEEERELFEGDESFRTLNPLQLATRNNDCGGVGGGGGGDDDDDDQAYDGTVDSGSCDSVPQSQGWE